MYLNKTDKMYNSLKISVMVFFDLSQTKKACLIKFFFLNLTNSFERDIKNEEK